MEITFGMVFGGLVLAVVCVAPAIMVMNHKKLFKKLHLVLPLLMIGGGMGLIILVAWLVNVGKDWGLTVWIGVPGFIALVAVGIMILIGVSDLDIGKPSQWGFFALPALATIVIMTSGPTWDYISAQFSSNAETLKAQVEGSK